MEQDTLEHSKTMKRRKGKVKPHGHCKATWPGAICPPTDSKIWWCSKLSCRNSVAVVKAGSIEASDMVAQCGGIRAGSHGSSMTDWLRSPQDLIVRPVFPYVCTQVCTFVAHMHACISYRVIHGMICIQSSRRR